MIKQAVESCLHSHFQKDEISNPKAKILPIRSSGPDSCISVLLFSANRPVLVIKMPRIRHRKIANTSIENEFKILSLLSRKGQISSHVPKIIDMLKIDGENLLVTKFIEGTMLNEVIDNELGPKEFDKYSFQATKILLLMKKKSVLSSTQVNKTFIDNNVTSPAKKAGEYFPQHLNRMQNFLNSFFIFYQPSGEMLASCMYHADFNPWNILFEKNGNQRILDWEDASEDGLPMLDLYNFFTILFRIAIIGESLDAKNRPIEAKILRAESVISAYQSCSKEYKSLFGLSDELSDLLFLIYALKSVLFFVTTKRNAFAYAENWLTMLSNNYSKGFFEQYMKRTVQSFKG
ncbi:MAG: phosphotransferase [Candidatus Margulisiibacteriota bacterium]